MEFIIAVLLMPIRIPFVLIFQLLLIDDHQPMGFVCIMALNILYFNNLFNFVRHIVSNASLTFSNA